MNQEPSFPELSGNIRRQAVPSIRGIVYQAWCSIDAWLRLTTADQIIYLEGAEDFDVVRSDGAITVQVKHNKVSISLGTAKAIEALENFWELTTKDLSRQIDFHYLTTSLVVKEQDGTFGDINGLDAWRAACTNEKMAIEVASYLKTRLKERSALQQFVDSATPNELQGRLFRRFHWLTDQPRIEAVQQSVDERIRVLLFQQKKGVSLASKVRIQLESYFWQTILHEESRDRRLTFGELLKQVEDATTVYLPVQVDKLPILLGPSRQGHDLLKLLKGSVPKPPVPLIQRVELVCQLEDSVNQRRLMVLTGTVFKGKTTLAQLVADTLCTDAWWINLTGRQTDQVDSIFLALADEIESDICPSLIVIDDLDISPTANRAYLNSLALCLHRARTSCRAVLLTAQGGSSDTALLSDFQGIEIFEVPELTMEEVVRLCLQERCPASEARIWGFTVHAFSRGHPKLIQVRIAELADRGWPQPVSTNFGATSSAADTVRQIARRLLSDTFTQEVVEFLYCVSESSVLLHRSVVIRLAEAIGGIRNPGDLLDGLVGRWIECVEGNWFRTTSILNGSAGDVWSAEHRALMHIKLHDSILQKQTLDPAEAAALLYHSYFGKEPRRIAKAALTLQTIRDAKAQEAVERNLLWLPYVALEAGQHICNDIIASAALRGLQFRVAVTLDSDTLPQICVRWVEETTEVLHTEMRQGMQRIMWGSIAGAESAKIPLRMRLDTIQELSRQKLTGILAEVSAAGMQSFFEKNDPRAGMPANGTLAQVMLAFCTRWVRDAKTLHELAEWLDLQATDEIRREFETVLEWPIVKTSGAFVHGAWAAECEKVTDWAPWIELFEFIDGYSKRRASPAFGREAAKAKAIVLTEYLSRADEALQVLSSAEASFGESPILKEQRANVLFQVNDDEQVLKVWNELVATPIYGFELDPFAYRRAALSASRLEKWEKAEEIFRIAIASIDPNGLAWTKFGLMVDCSMVISLGGCQKRATKLIADAVASLPATAGDDGDERWEAVQRAAAEVCRRIESALWNPSEAAPKFQPGHASSPGLREYESHAGQGMRTAMLRALIAKLCACLGVSMHYLKGDEFADLGTSQYIYVRWLVAEAQLARSFALGAGGDFIPAIARLDATTSALSLLQERGIGMEAIAVNDQPTAPDRWFGLLVAGACCAGNDLNKHLASWLAICDAAPGVLDGVGILVRQLQAGASVPRHELWQLAIDPLSSAGIRCGAAVRLLLEPLSPEKVFNLQGLVTSSLVCDASFMCQEVCNIHLALRFASTWEKFIQSPFNFSTPRVTVPALHETVQSLKEGRGTLRTLLIALSVAMGQPLGSFIDRVR